jgi:hypothetical protein
MLEGSSSLSRKGSSGGRLFPSRREGGSRGRREKERIEKARGREGGRERKLTHKVGRVGGGEHVCEAEQGNDVKRVDFQRPCIQQCMFVLFLCTSILHIIITCKSTRIAHIACKRIDL